ncbi:MAG: IclR family transcriptional regulator [Phenylobacterium sp.]|uniref:IclR family transcriptional regulator n=1 Tax=Phenylobacterium sp. TaxID=1871053 RepID=UPI00391A8EBF
MDRDAVKSARRAFEILELFDRERRPLALKDILEALGYPASSGSALLKSLVALGYLDYDRDRRTYFPTMRISALGAWVPDALFGDGALLGAMERLRAVTGETVILATQSDLFAQYVHLLHSAEPLQFSVPPGARRPLAASGLGWCLLSAKSDEEIERLRRRINAEPGQAQPLSREALMGRVNEVRTRGYAVSKHTVSQGAGVIGAPLPRGAHGRVFALGVAGPVGRLEAKEALIIGELRAALERLRPSQAEAHRHDREGLPA